MLFGVARTESVAAHAIGDVVARVAPGLAPYSHPLGHATVLGAAGVALGQVLSRVYGATEQAGSAIEPAYQAVPDSPNVSGGPISILDWQSFGREGRRFVNMALTAEQIEKVTGKPAQDPIRAFVGLDSAVSPNARAYLAREELENLGAFERSTIAVFAPTGTGYVNYVAAETLEYLTGGDVASVAVQYSVRPSFLSLDRVETAWESYLALFNGLSGRLRGMAPADRPRVLLFGESLGSLASQDVFAKGGVIGFDMLGIDRALFVGTPQASEWRNKWLADPAGVDPDGMVVEVSGLDEWVALPAEQRARARIVLLTHHNDPICKFGPSLAIQQPYWLGKPETRPPGVPHEVPFVPGIVYRDGHRLVDRQLALPFQPPLDALLEGRYIVQARLARAVEQAEVLGSADAALFEDVQVAVVEQAVVLEALDVARDLHAGAAGQVDDRVVALAGRQLVNGIFLVRFGRLLVVPP